MTRGALLGNTLRDYMRPAGRFFFGGGMAGFEIVPIRVSETCQNLSGHVKCPCMVIRWTCPFFATCNYLGLLELQEETPQADINQDNVSLAGVLQGAVGRAVDTPVFALLLDDNTRFSHDRRWDGACSRDASGRRFPNPSASRARIFCSSWNRLLCSMLVMFLRARCWLVGAFSVHIQPKTNYGESHTGADVTLSDIRLAVERLWHFLLYGLHLQRAPK